MNAIDVRPGARLLFFADDRRLPGGQLPLPTPLDPDVREPTVESLTGERGLALRLDRLLPHDDGGVPVDRHRLHVPDEGRIVNKAVLDQLDSVLAALEDLVVRSVDHEVLGPELLNHRHVFGEYGGVLRAINFQDLLLQTGRFLCGWLARQGGCQDKRNDGRLSRCQLPAPSRINQTFVKRLRTVCPAMGLCL